MSENTEQQERVAGGLVGVVTGTDVHVTRAGVGLAAAARDLRVRQGGGQFLAAGRDLHVEQGGGSMLAAGNRLDVHQGGGGVLAARRAQVSRSVVGVLLAQHVELEDSRVLLAPGPTAAVAALVGVGVGLLLAGRRRRRVERSADDGGPDVASA